MKGARNALPDIERMIRRLQTHGDKEIEIRSFVQFLYQVKRFPAECKPQRKRAGKGQVQRELAAIRSASSKLLKQIDALSAQTIQSLWDAPAEKIDGTFVRVNVNQLLEQLTFSLQRLDQAAQRAKVINHPDTMKGNATDKKIASFTKVSAFYYERITDLKPDYSNREDGFKAMLHFLFKHFDIDANVDRATRNVIASS